jgi:hypothetical protein
MRNSDDLLLKPRGIFHRIIVCAAILPSSLVVSLKSTLPNCEVTSLWVFCQEDFTMAYLSFFTLAYGPST